MNANKNDLGGRSEPLPTDGDEGEQTIDELARGAAIPVSTVRMYQHRGLLPPPVRRGRVGFYGASHRARLRLIADLQGRGFSLAAIREALDAWAAGRSLDHLLGVGDLAPSLQPAPLRLGAAELASRFAGVELTQDDMRRAVELGLVALDGAEIVVTNAAFVDIGPAVARLGVPVSEILDEYAALQGTVAAIAERFRGVFERRVWSSFDADGMPADRIPSLTRDVEQLAALATAVVTVELQARFAAFAADYVRRAEDRAVPGAR